MTAISANSTIGITLASPVYSNPVVINPGITISNSLYSGKGIYANSGPWTIQNAGIITETNTTLGFGVVLNDGSISNESGASIYGYAGIGGNGAEIITNAGRITGNPEDGIGVFFAAVGGGYISNQSGGAISGATGIFGRDTIAITIVNAGSITGSPNLTSRGHGVVAYGNLSVTNQSSATVSGFDGVSGDENQGGPNNLTVLNAGDIAGNPTPTIRGSAVYAGAGVYLTNGGGITNQKGATISGFNGISSFNPAVTTVINAGTILGNFASYVSVNGGIRTRHAVAIGIAFGYGGYVNNQSSALIGGYLAFSSDEGASTIVNAGNIIGNAATGVGVNMEKGGVVTNQRGGTISGGAAGIDSSGTLAVTVVNAGLVADNPTYGRGVYIQFDSSGTVTNQSGGTIEGIYLASGSSGSITNQSGGTISGPSGISGYLALAATVVNYGDVEGEVGLGAAGNITNKSSAVISGGVGIGGTNTGAVTVVNAGTIMGNHGGIGGRGALVVLNAGHIAGNSTSGSGIYLAAGGRVTNQITASIYGRYGIVGEVASTIVNAGTIAGYKAFGFGVDLTAMGSVTNQSGGTISGSRGIYGRARGASYHGTLDRASGAVTVINAGSIAGLTEGGFGIVLLDGGFVSNAAAGTITGVQTTGVYISGGTGTVINAGVISGKNAVLFSAGYSNLQVVDPGAVFNGVVDGGNTIGATAASTLELASGVSAGTLSGLGTEFINFSSIAFDTGVNWFVAGDTSGLAGTISGFAQGDTIEITGITVTGSAYAGGVLALTEATDAATLDLSGSFTNSEFAVTNVSGGADVSLVPARTLSWTGDSSTAFDAAANWNDITDDLSPALLAPNPEDTVEFNSVDGAVAGTGTVSAIDVGSSGSGVLQLSDGTTLVASSLDAGIASSAVGQIGLTGTGTDLSVTGAATVADDGSGVMSVLNGATFSASNLTIGSQSDSSGAVVVSGDNTVVNVSGDLNVGTSLGTGDVTIGPGAVVNALVVNLQGEVVLENGELDPTVNLINQGQTAGGSGRIAAGDIVDEGVIQAGGSKPSQKLLLVSGTILGGGPWTINGSAQAQANGNVGVLQINTGGTLELTGPVLNAGSTTFTDDVTPQSTYTVNDSVVEVNFEDASGVLKLDDIGGFAGTIAAFRKGDEFVIVGGTLSNIDVTNGDMLTVSDSGNDSTDQIIFGSAISASGFTIVNNNTIQVACFAAGTLIQTAAGWAAVEDLRVGDRVVTNEGCNEAIVWLGQRTVNCGSHPKPETVWPVRVSAGTFGKNVPARDLYLSPDHAVFVNGVLVPVKLLVNGTNVVQIKRDLITYLHVELTRHDVIVAEGLPVESYLDPGGRTNLHRDGETIRLFSDFTERPAPESSHVWETHGVAPLVITGEKLVAARRVVTAYVPVRLSRAIGSNSRSG